MASSEVVGENYDQIMELYNVQRFNRQAFGTPSTSEDGRDSSYSRLGSARECPMNPSMNKEWRPKNIYKPTGSRGYYSGNPSEQGGNQYYNAGSSYYGSFGPKGEASAMEALRTTTSSRDEASVSIRNASDVESEWIEEDEPGVYITIRQLVDRTRELRRMRFSSCCSESQREVALLLGQFAATDRLQDAHPKMIPNTYLAEDQTGKEWLVEWHGETSQTVDNESQNQGYVLSKFQAARRSIYETPTVCYYTDEEE